MLLVIPDVFTPAEVAACVADLDAATWGAPPPPPPAEVVPVDDGFAPGDEPAPEDPDDEGPGEGPPALHGEDAALALLQAQMGAAVLGQVDNP